MDEARFVDRVGAEFELREVQHTDAVAEFLDQDAKSDDWGMVIATTDDNWAHASRLFISWDLADLVSCVPLLCRGVGYAELTRTGGTAPPGAG
jgi:hypothetical protein